jgi:hypothetical protein
VTDFQEAQGATPSLGLQLLSVETRGDDAVDDSLRVVAAL